METDTRSATSGRSVLVAVIVAGSVAAVSFLGGRATAPNVDGWYADAERPAFAPPDAVFAPVWIGLYAVMAFAAWWAWRGGAPLGPWFLQLGLNLAWPWTFFAAQWLWFGAVVIMALVAAIVWTMRVFWPHARLASLLLAPYLAWVLYATALTVGIAALN